MCELVLALPAQLLDAHTPIGQVIDGADNLEIALPGAHGNDPERILLRLRKGVRVTLRRSAQAVVISADQSPPVIRVSDIPPALHRPKA